MNSNSILGKYGKVCKIGIVLLVGLLPFILFPYSIAGDYPNHYAAFSIALQSQGDAAHHFYVVDWALLPHMAMGLVALFVKAGLSSDGAFHLFLLLSIASPILGCWAVHRQIHGETSWILLLGFSFLYNICIYHGFIDFNFSLGLVFLLYALLLRFTANPSLFGYLFLSIGSAVVFISHLLGFLIFGLLLVCQRITLISNSVGSYGKKAALFFSPVFWLTPTAILAIIWMGNGTGKLPHEQMGLGLPNIDMIFRAFLAPPYFGNYGPVMFFAPLFIIMIPYALKHRLLVVDREQFIAIGGLFLATVFLSQRVGGVEIDFRLGMATYLLISATVRLGCWGPPPNRFFAFVSVLLLFGGLSLQWCVSWKTIRATHEEVLEIRRALQTLPLQSRLIAGSSGDSRKFFHAGAFITSDREGFFPQMFQVVQPIRARKTFAAINMPGLEMWGERLVEAAYKKPTVEKEGSWFNLRGHYGWPLRFDYLIWFSTTEELMEYFPFLEKIDRGNHFYLYRIHRPLIISLDSIGSQLQNDLFLLGDREGLLPYRLGNNLSR